MNDLNGMKIKNIMLDLIKGVINLLTSFPWVEI